MSQIDRSKRLFVRSALIAGSTVATMIGAQTLAVLDQRTATTQTVQAASLNTQQSGTSLLLGTSGVVRLRRSDDEEQFFQNNNSGTSGSFFSSPSIVQQFPSVSTRSSR